MVPEIMLSRSQCAIGEFVLGLALNASWPPSSANERGSEEQRLGVEENSLDIKMRWLRDVRIRENFYHGVVQNSVPAMNTKRAHGHSLPNWVCRGYL